MFIEFKGGPIDGVKREDEHTVQCELWLIGKRAPLAVYVRDEQPGGEICYKFDRYCSAEEAAELKAKHRTGEAGGMSTGQGY